MHRSALTISENTKLSEVGVSSPRVHEAWALKLAKSLSNGLASQPLEGDLKHKHPALSLTRQVKQPRQNL